MTVIHGGHPGFGDAAFAIDGRSVVAIHAEGQQFTLQDADLLLALGSFTGWAQDAVYIQDGLTYASDLTVSEVVAVAARSMFDSQCSAREAPMVARAGASKRREHAAARVATDGTDEESALLLASDLMADVRFILASGPNLPLAAAMVLAQDPNRDVLNLVRRRHLDSTVRRVAALSLDRVDVGENLSLIAQVSRKCRDRVRATSRANGPLVSP